MNCGRQPLGDRRAGGPWPADRMSDSDASHDKISWGHLNNLLQGTPSAKYGKNSITAAGMKTLHAKLLKIAMGERGFQGKSLLCCLIPRKAVGQLKLV